MDIVRTDLSTSYGFLVGRKRQHSAADVIRQAGIDPMRWLAERFKEEPSVDIAIELLPYAYPKLKAVEVTAAVNTTIRVVIGGLDE